VARQPWRHLGERGFGHCAHPLSESIHRRRCWAFSATAKPSQADGLGWPETALQA